MNCSISRLENHSRQDLLDIGQRILGADIRLRDLGLLESALERPCARVFGSDG